jgi:hypothetical protein
MRGRITVGVVACVAALGVAGCGGDDETTTTTTTPEPAVTGASGATGAESVPEGTADVEALLEQTFAASGLTEGEAACVAGIVAPQVSDKALTDVQDPAYVEELLQDQKGAIEDCEGK